MKHIRKINIDEAVDHEKNESSVYEELEDAFMRILIKGTGINPNNVKSVDSYNKYMIIHTRHGEHFRIDVDIKHNV